MSMTMPKGVTKDYEMRGYPVDGFDKAMTWEQFNRAPFGQMVNSGFIVLQDNLPEDVTFRSLTLIGSRTVDSSVAPTWNAFLMKAAVLTITGTTTISEIAYAQIKQPTLTDSSAVTVTTAASLLLGPPPVAGGSVTITNAYSLYIKAGTLPAGGKAIFVSGTPPNSATQINNIIRLVGTWNTGTPDQGGAAFHMSGAPAGNSFSLSGVNQTTTDQSTVRAYGLNGSSIGVRTGSGKGVNVAVRGVATGAAVNIGGYFNLADAGPAVANLTSIALLADNWTGIDNILGAMSNGNLLWYVEDDGTITHASEFGRGKFQVKVVEELLTVAVATYTDTAISIPADAVVLAVSAKLTVVPPGTTSYNLGVPNFPTRYANGVASGSSPGTRDAIRYYSSPTVIRFTPNATPSTNAGRVRVIVWYYISVAGSL